MSKSTLSASFNHLLKRASQYTHTKYQKHVGGDGPTDRQFVVLQVLSSNQGVSQTDLVKMTGIDRSTLADMVARMTKSGLVVRERTKNDARANSIKLTDAGKKTLQAYRSKVKKAETEALKLLPVTKQKELMNLLLVFSDELDKEAEANQAVAKKPAKKKAAKKPAKKKAAKKPAKKKAVAKKPAKKKAAAKKPAKKKAVAKKPAKKKAVAKKPAKKKAVAKKPAKKKVAAKKPAKKKAAKKPAASA